MNKSKETARIGTGSTYTGVDRLSLLPNDILSRVFTFLTVDESVRTSALSKRYKTLYASLPDLNFNASRFRHSTCFRGFIDRVLNLRDHSTKVNSLTITVGRSWNPPISMADFSGVLSYAISHGVRHINIRYICSDEYPSCIYSCELTTLKLSSPGFSLTQKLCFKQLVSLHLEDTDIKTCDFFSICPCMEELSLIKCGYRGQTLSICAPRLRRVTILDIDDWSGRSIVEEISLSSPMLELFSFRGSIPGFSTGDDGLPFLESITIDVCKVDGRNTEFYECDLPILTNMLEQLGHAKSVTLSYSTAESLVVNPELLAQKASPFKDLKYLHFKSMGSKLECIFNVPAYVIAYLVKDPQNAEICHGTHEA